MRSPSWRERRSPLVTLTAATGAGVKITVVGAAAAGAGGAPLAAQAADHSAPTQGAARNASLRGALVPVVDRSGARRDEKPASSTERGALHEPAAPRRADPAQVVKFARAGARADGGAKPAVPAAAPGCRAMVNGMDAGPRRCAAARARGPRTGACEGGRACGAWSARARRQASGAPSGWQLSVVG
jgi:hypothetical protein